MTKSVWLILILLGCTLLSACSAVQGSTILNTPTTGAEGERPEPPAEYADMKNPYKTDDEDAISKGEALYRANCSSCHGEQGLGDGLAGASLNPKPGNLARDQENLSDAYLFWRISEGGILEPFNSLMPAWKALMSEQQIWQVITYIRTF